jgi:hypothetical protein
MPKVGTFGLDMMYRTCTVQTNLDFSSESDMVKKLRVSIALQPIATALFANSPFTDGKPNGFLSFRSEIWRDTDNQRAGMLPFAFEPGMGFERWVDYALDVPMYFVKRGDDYIDVAGQSFRDLLAGRLPTMQGEHATLSDWANHVTTIFPEVRLKRFLEMRGADSGPWRRLPALPALWVGLLYDEDSLEAAWDLSRTGAPTNGSSCAMTCRGAVLTPSFAIRGCSTSRANASSSPAAGLRAATATTSTAATRRAISSRSRITSRAAPPRPRSCWRNSTGRGAARSSRYSLNTRIDQASLRAKRSIQRIANSTIAGLFSIRYSPLTIRFLSVTPPPPRARAPAPPP